MVSKSAVLTLSFLPAILIVMVISHSAAPAGNLDPVTFHVFYDNDIHFAPEDSGRYATEAVESLDKGRVISRTVRIDAPSYPAQIIARVTVKPIPKDEQSVHDKWDRAGNVRLRREGVADIEVVKFVTAYGGITTHEVDVTHLAPLIKDDCNFLGFVDTWVSPAWKMDFSLTFRPVEESGAPHWVEPVLYEESLTEEGMRDGPTTARISIPSGTRRVVLNYLVSGHCTDGRDADEFVSKDNVVMVDGRKVYCYRPWRDDCRDFRAINPYCRRWSDGSWSADYSRSGWCPGDWVPPHAIDLSEFLTPGEHVIEVAVEDIRPKGEDGHLGYWRVSGHLVGWNEN